MKPYSVDFRQKIIEVYEQEDISIRKLAQRFKVAKSFIQKLLKQHRQTGDIRPQTQGGHPPSKLQKEELVVLIEIIESNNDATRMHSHSVPFLERSGAYAPRRIM